jgi:hypothetical protein
MQPNPLFNGVLKMKLIVPVEIIITGIIICFPAGGLAVE